MFQAVFRVSDAAIGILLSFLSIFLQSVVYYLQLEQLQEFASSLPQSLFNARALAGRQSNQFRRYICCPKCHSLHRWSILKANQSDHLRVCDHVKFPQHPQPQHRKACGAPLATKVKLFSGHIKYIPYWVFCYKSIIESLQQMIMRFLGEVWEMANRNEQQWDIQWCVWWKHLEGFSDSEW